MLFGFGGISEQFSEGLFAIARSGLGEQEKNCIDNKFQRDTLTDSITRLVQHSVLLTASPPKDVSLNFSDISRPVCFMAAIQLSKGMK